MSLFDVLRSRVVVFGIVLAVVLAYGTGCEWTSSGSEGSWNESMSWVNFSGLYRAASGRNLVGDFTTSGGTGGTVPSNGNGAGGDIEHAFSGEQGLFRDTQFTTVSGTIDFMNRGVSGWRLKPGSVTIDFVGSNTPATGSLTDNGNNQLSGTFSQAPGGQVHSASGSVNYDTGAWSISLSEPFAQPAQFSYSYVVLQSGGGSTGDGGAVGGGTAPGGGAVSTVGGVINTIQVEQLGNQLTFRTSRGHELTGQLGIVTLPGGDDTGRSAGDVSATYEVSGTIDGDTVRITGTLSGVYIPPADIQFANPVQPVVSGIMSDRILQGIWMQSNGTADVFGRAPQQSVPVNVGDFEPIVEDATTD